MLHPSYTELMIADKLGFRNDEIMFSSNEKISGRQAFRLLVFDLLGLGTLLIPAAVAGFCGRDGIFCIIVGTVLGLLFLRLLVYAIS